MDTFAVFRFLGLALVLGLLVGLQRERAENKLGGFRTFPLITVLGTLCTLLSQSFGGWIVGLGLVSLAVVIYTANQAQIRTGTSETGMTTEVAMLVMFSLGAYIPVGSSTVATVLGGGVAVLLHFKPQLHAIAGTIGDQDFRAIMQFVLITLVILPVLPNENMGPFMVLNPFKIWLMVVLIVGISLGGYVTYKMFGDRVGTVASGILGGMISSTATTVSYSRRTKEIPEVAGLAVMVILLANTILYARLLVLIGATSPDLLAIAAWPFVIVMGVFAILALFCWLKKGTTTTPSTEHGNPSELRSAIVFALMYALVLIGVAAGKKYFGNSGLLVVSLISGLTDMDAIALSLSQMVSDNKLSGETAWRLIMGASMANLIFKAGIAGFLGGKKLFGKVALTFGIGFAASTLVLWFWPDH